jgi:hypothetical protein
MTAVWIRKWDRGKVTRLVACPPAPNPQRVVVHDLEGELARIVEQVQGATVGVGQGAGFEKDGFHQVCPVSLGTEGAMDADERLQELGLLGA